MSSVSLFWWHMEHKATWTWPRTKPQKILTWSTTARAGHTMPNLLLWLQSWCAFPLAGAGSHSRRGNYLTSLIRETPPSIPSLAAGLLVKMSLTCRSNSTLSHASAGSQTLTPGTGR